MSYLLDTHALIWALARPALLSEAVGMLVRDASVAVHVSPISAYEIALKHSFGKLDVADGLLRDFPGSIAQAGFAVAPLTASAALQAGKLILDHRDPFDRLLSAQAMEADWTFLSKDARVDVFGVRRVW